MKRRWNMIVMSVLVLLTVLVPLVGVVIATMNLSQKNRRQQVLLLFAIGVAMTALWVWNVMNATDD